MTNGDLTQQIVVPHAYEYRMLNEMITVKVSKSVLNVNQTHFMSCLDKKESLRFT